MKQGFTIFFAVLVAALALAIGLAILDLTLRQLALSEVTSQSQYAIYAADTGVECALFWDSKYGGSGSAFATSSASLPVASGVPCSSTDIAAAGTPGSPPTAWVVAKAATAATTTFTLTLASTPASCVTVQVGKYLYTDPATGKTYPQTNIFSFGHNTCTSGAKNIVERELQVSY